MRCFDIEKVRLHYIAAQVTRVDLKVDLAITETIRIYNHALRSAAATAVIPGGATTTRVSVAAVICKSIVTCFGVPKVSPETVQQIVKSIVWDDMGNNGAMVTAEVVASVGLFSTVLLLGLPVFLASGTISSALVVPATARLILMLACDVILILTRAFKVSMAKYIGQPLKADIENAAVTYRLISSKVHKKVRKLIPRAKGIVTSFRSEKIKASLEQIIHDFKGKAMEDDKAGKQLKVYENDSSDSETMTLVPQSSGEEAMSI